eukprot:scaffold70195_cov27-Prasinocladus_malaysianus.AAC.2
MKSECTNTKTNSSSNTNYEPLISVTMKIHTMMAFQRPDASQNSDSVLKHSLMGLLAIQMLMVKSGSFCNSTYSISAFTLMFEAARGHLLTGAGPEPVRSMGGGGEAGGLWESFWCDRSATTLAGVREV